MDAQTWKEIPISEGMSVAAQRTAHRLNNLGSLFNFSYFTLGHTRLTRGLHGYICRELEREKLRVVMEIPRDHFKTTCATISASMWWALPFNEDDEELMRALDYGDEWIRWMKRAHDTCTRTLIASEVTKNARKMGDKISQHYKSNARFRFLFPEIIPTGDERWNQDSMIHRRSRDGMNHSEGTYDIIGAEAALQSNHYDRAIEDDMVGEEATYSDVVMSSLISWHDKLPGIFDSIPGKPDDLGDQLVIGNRWSERDLNAHVRQTDKSFHFITHSAEGGCCDMHPANTPIFPEEFSMAKLAHIRAIQGHYVYSCQFLNNPIDAQAVRFKFKLRHYEVAPWETGNVTPQNTANYWQLSHDMKRMNFEDLDNQTGAQPRRLKMAMRHEVKDGEVLPDVRAADLDRIMIIDPNHSGEYGRSRNAILVIGIYWQQEEPRRIYFLDAFAEACSHEKWIAAAIGENSNCLGLAWRWKIHRLYGEFEAAGQQGWSFYIKEKLKHRSIERSFTVYPLKTDRSENAKTQRIIGMEPIYENGLWWMPRSSPGASLFMDEFTRYPNGSTLDLLDLAGYSPQTFGAGTQARAREFVARDLERRRQQIQSIGVAGY